MVNVSPAISAASAGSVMPSVVTRTSVQTPMKSSIVAFSFMAETDTSVSGFSRFILMSTPSSERTSSPSCSVPVIVSTTRAPSFIMHWATSTSPPMFISAVPSAPMVTVTSMPRSASGRTSPSISMLTPYHTPRYSSGIAAVCASDTGRDSTASVVCAASAGAGSAACASDSGASVV